MNANDDRVSISCVTAILLAAIALPSLPQALMAQDAGSAPAPSDKTGANLVRDPFWPVGYWPRPKVVNTVNTNGSGKIEIVSVTPVPPPPPEDPPKWPDLRVRGIMEYRNGLPAEAVIEGIKEHPTAGQTIRMVAGKYEYSWKINSVSTRTGVSYTRLGFRKIK